MLNKIKALEEIGEEIKEPLGISKKLTPQNGYYITSLRGTKGDYTIEDTKVHINFSFKGTNQAISFGHFKSKRGYNKKLQNNKEFANHYGEYIAYLILKQLGKKGCKVDLAETDIIYPYNNKVKSIEGVLSHLQLSQEENFKSLGIIVEDYRYALPKRFKDLTERGKTNSDKNNTNIEIALEAIEEYCKKNNQSQKIPEIRKSFFDMCIFDIKFANRDRHEDNFGLKVNSLTGEINFYPLFDNEQILGMQEERSSVEKYLNNPKAYQTFKRNELTSCIGIPGKTQKISPTELLSYLLEHYYEETKESLDDFSRYGLQDLEEVLNVCSGLSKEHKEFAKKIYLEREKEILQTVNEVELKKKNQKKIEAGEGPDL